MKKVASAPFLLSASSWLFVALFGACQTAPMQTDAELLEGYWESTEEGREYSMNFAGNSLFYYAGEDFWYDTEFTLPASTDPRQLHATIIRDNSGAESGYGEVIVAIFKIEAETLTVVTKAGESEGIVDSFDSDGASRFDLKRAQPQAGRTGPPANK